MAKIELLNTLTTQLKDWADSMEYSSHRLEETLLQNDNADKVEEKLVSIGISAFLVCIASLVIGLFVSIAAGVVTGIISFVAGLVLSRIVNKKLFGNVRTVEQLTTEEVGLIEASKALNQSFSKLHKQLKVMALGSVKIKSPILFTRYPVYRDRILRVQLLISNHSAENLSFKYRKRYNSLAKKYASILREFDRIYANAKA
jgi:hypothetical protein